MDGKLSYFYESYLLIIIYLHGDNNYTYMIVGIETPVELKTPVIFNFFIITKHTLSST